MKSEPTLAGKHIMVTGSSRGIGAGIARKAAESGARVAITYAHRPEAAQEVVKSLPGEGHLCLQVNTQEEASIQQAFDQVMERWQKLDGLVNNAGITKDQLLLRMKTEDFDEVINTNLRGTFLCTRAAVKVMMKARTGSIVNITSVIGQTGNPGQANYAASKAGIEAFSRSIALEMASRNVRLNCVAPGFIATEMTGALTDAQKQAILDKVPLGRIGSTDDVAHAVCFLLSDQAQYITGHTVNVNGGLFMN